MEQVIGRVTTYNGTEHRYLRGFKVKIVAVIRDAARLDDDAEGAYLADDKELARAGGATADDPTEVQPWLEREGRFCFVTSDPRVVDLECFTRPACAADGAEVADDRRAPSPTTSTAAAAMKQNESRGDHPRGPASPASRRRASRPRAPRHDPAVGALSLTAHEAIPSVKTPCSHRSRIVANGVNLPPPERRGGDLEPRGHRIRWRRGQGVTLLMSSLS